MALIDDYQNDPRFKSKTPEEQEILLRRFKGKQLQAYQNDPRFTSKTPEEQEILLRRFKKNKLGIDVESQDDQTIGTPATSRSRRGPRNPDSQPGVDWSAAGRGFVQGATLGFADEIAGGVESAFTDKPYEQARDESRAAFKEAEERAPGSYLAGEIGSMVVPGSAAVKGGKLAAEGAIRAGKTGQAILRGAGGAGVTGVGTGSVSGAGYSEGDFGSEEFIEDTGTGALVGGGVGLVTGGAGAGTAGAIGNRAARKMDDKVKKRQRESINDIRKGILDSNVTGQMSEQSGKKFRKHINTLFDDNTNPELAQETASQVQSALNRGDEARAFQLLEDNAREQLRIRGGMPQEWIDQLSPDAKFQNLEALKNITNKGLGIATAPISLFGWAGRKSANAVKSTIKSLDQFVTNTSPKKLEAIGKKIEADPELSKQLRNRLISTESVALDESVDDAVNRIFASPQAIATYHYSLLSDPEYRKSVRDILPENFSLLLNRRNSDDNGESEEPETGILDRASMRQRTRQRPRQ